MVTNSKPLASNIFCYLEVDVRRNKRKMWGFATWEIFDKARGTGFEIRIFPQISHDEQVSKFGFFHGFPQFLRGGPTQKILKIWIFPRFLGILKDGLTQIFLKLGLFRSFLGILKGWNHTQKLANPRTYSRISQDFEGMDPPKNLANPQISLDREPCNCAVWKVLTNCFSSLPSHPLETSGF